MQALILAAGRGSRLGKMADELPKCLLQIGGKPLIEHQLQALAEAGASPVRVVIGYGADLVREVIGSKAETLLNPRYEKTNSLYSFWLAREWIRDSLLILNSDVLFSREILYRLLLAGPDALAYDSSSGQAPEHMKVLVREGMVCNLSKELDPQQSAGENVGIIYLSEAVAKAVVAEADKSIRSDREDAFLAEAIRAVAHDCSIRAVDIAGLPWTEIDSPYDLDRARRETWPAIRERTGTGLLRRRRRRAALFALAGLALFGLMAGTWVIASQLGTAVWETLPVQNARRVEIKVRNVPQEWWLAGKQEAVRTTLSGPRRVRIDFRCLLAQGAKDRVPYVVELRVGGKVRDWHKFWATPSDTASYPDSTVADRDKVDLPLPEGQHSIEVRLVAGDVAGGLLVRIRTIESSE